MPFMTRIPSDLARFGLRVDVVPGWETRGSSAFAPAGVTCHWTAGPRGTTGRPSLNVCVNGRPGLAGPLCNVYLARDGVCVVVAAGRANHAGEGGFRGLVGNSAVYGIEAESGGDGDWTPAMLAAYPRLVAALLSGLGRDASWAHGHHEWAPTRKIDIRDIMPTVRAGAAAALANPAAPSGGFLMTLNDQQQAEVYNDLKAIRRDLGVLPIPVWNDRGAVGEKTAREVLGEIHAAVTGGGPAVSAGSFAGLSGEDRDAIAQAIVDQLPADLAEQVADRLAARLAS